MRFARRASLLVAFCLLTSAAASAECAWVLWNEVTTTRLSTATSNAEWVVVGVGGDKKDCERQKAAKLSSLANKIKGANNMASDTIGPDVTRVFRVLCLPDTVDPRGPKGK